MPASHVLYSLHPLSHVIVTTILWSRLYYVSHFRDEQAHTRFREHETCSDPKEVRPRDMELDPRVRHPRVVHDHAWEYCPPCTDRHRTIPGGAWNIKDLPCRSDLGPIWNECSLYTGCSWNTLWDMLWIKLVRDASRHTKRTSNAEQKQRPLWKEDTLKL